MITSREVARRVLSRVAEGSYSTLALGGELGRSSLSAVDRAFVTELVYGTIKHRLRLDRALASGAPRGLRRLDERVLDALRMAAYQVLFLRVPAHAAVDDCVGALRRLRGDRLGGFANALLRRMAERGEPPLPSEGDLRLRLEIEFSAPRWLVDHALEHFGEDEAREFLSAVNRPPPLWLRTNRLRTDRESLRARLAGERPHAEIGTSLLAPEAIALRQAGDITRLGSFGEGWCTVQDLAAQLVARLAAPQPDERLLDACAGVGGKATHLAELAGGRALIDAADRSETKLALAQDSAHRLGVTIRTIACDLTDSGIADLAPTYDCVLLDAPCSGLGVLRRHPEGKWRHSPERIVELSGLQARLLAALAPRVRRGGRLVYSVCTYTEKEGPAQIAALLADGEFHIEVATSIPTEVLAPDGSLRTWPHRHDADAFYAVRLRKR